VGTHLEEGAERFGDGQESVKEEEGEEEESVKEEEEEEEEEEETPRVWGARRDDGACHHTA
jgi:hypothetical protein